MRPPIKHKVQNRNEGTRGNPVIIVQPAIQSADILNSDDGNERSIEEPTSLTTHRTIWNLIDALARLVGVPIFEEVKLNYRLVGTWFIICVAFLSLFYTIFLVWPSISKVLEVICLIGVLLPATLKYKLTVEELRFMVSMSLDFEKIVKQNVDKIRADKLGEDMADGFKKVKVYMVIAFICFIVFTLYPSYAFLAERRLVPIMLLEFPYLDQTNKKGYLIGLGIMLTFGVLAVSGSVAFDLAILMLLLDYGSLVTLLVYDLDDYHKMMQNAEFSIKYRRDFFRNVCMKYHDINSYFKYFKNLFDTTIFQSMSILYGALICSVYAVFNNGWMSGYGFCVFCFLQFYIMCILGTYVEGQNDRLSQAFYFAPWYEYPIEVQKTFMALMHSSTFNRKELWIGSLAPLNVQTGLAVTKSIYSYYTAMTNLE